MKKIKSHCLREGSVIGIVAPASPVHDQAEIDQACGILAHSGFKPVLGRTVKPMPGDLAGSDWERQADLETIWADPSIDAIWSLRGGYGCLRLLERLNYRLLAETPKILIGYSDLTALELGLWKRAGLVTFHGPVLINLTNDFSRESALAMVCGENNSEMLKWPETYRSVYTVFRSGLVQGPVFGGNLATLLSLLGTKYFPSLTGAILFIEEVGESAYRVDRMLTQLMLAGVLEDVAAVMVGRSVPTEPEQESDLISVFAERLERLKCPAAYGFPLGHWPEKWTIPQGVRAEVKMDSGELTLIEDPFVHQGNYSGD